LNPMFIEIGPASLVVEGQKDGRTFRFDRQTIEKRIKEILDDIANFLPLLKQKACRIRNTSHLPEVVRKMVEAAKLVDEATLTPMAAVAGAVSDEIKSFLKDLGLDMISVNNGGDISVHNKFGKALRIGIGDINAGRGTAYSLKIEGLRDYGLATSGFGGRSFTLGVADIGTVVAETGAIADAAATFICNRTDVETKKVVRRRASEIDPLTDIPDELVTVSVGELDRGLVLKALENGIEAAHSLKKGNVIHDAIVILGKETATTIGSDRRIKLEVQHGD
jgi:uncharacterized protein